MKDTTIPADLIELKARFDAWRASRKYVQEPIPDDLWSAAVDLRRRYPVGAENVVRELYARTSLTQ